MPRRPRLSIPTMFSDSPEGYALWDTEGKLVDRNEAFEKMLGMSDNGSSTEGVGVISGIRTSTISIFPPESAFLGESASGLIAHPNDPAQTFRIDAWPVTDDEGQVLAVLGRVIRSREEKTASASDPSQFWGARLQEELLRRRAAQRTSGLESLIGHGPDHDGLLRRVESVVKSDCSVAIIGEKSVGRHHLARLVHMRRQTADGTRHPLVPMDARSLPSEILARDFLGIVTSSEASRNDIDPPRWRVPEGSTVLIENLADLDTRLQDGISRAKGNVRLIGLARSIDEIKSLDPWFRSRVETMTIELQPLRNRIEEIPLLAQSLLDRFQAGGRRRLEGFAPEALERLKLYDWPGNWSELERIVKRILDKAAGPLITAEDIPAEIQGAYGGAWLRPNNAETIANRLESALDEARRNAVRKALERYGSNKAAAARALGVSRPKFYRLIAELGLE